MSPHKPTQAQCKDAGMAAVLLCLLLALNPHLRFMAPVAIILLVLDMITPAAYYYFAVLWFGFSEILGGIVSRIMLTIIYYAIITPIGLLRQRMGIDPLSLRRFKKEKKSVLVERNHTFVAADLRKPY
jgi:hypothetical protein